MEQLYKQFEFSFLSIRERKYALNLNNLYAFLLLPKFFSKAERDSFYCAAVLEYAAPRFSFFLFYIFLPIVHSVVAFDGAEVAFASRILNSARI